MKTKHTQGEWKVETTPSGLDIWGDDKCICIVDTSTEQEANAKLIAAAPELLEALQLLASQIKVHDTGGWYSGEIEKSENAIKKATE